MSTEDRPVHAASAVNGPMDWHRSVWAANDAVKDPGTEQQDEQPSKQRGDADGEQVREAGADVHLAGYIARAVCVHDDHTPVAAANLPREGLRAGSAHACD